MVDELDNRSKNSFADLKRDTRLAERDKHALFITLCKSLLSPVGDAINCSSLDSSRLELLVPLDSEPPALGWLVIADTAIEEAELDIVLVVVVMASTEDVADDVVGIVVVEDT